jgi:ankyrin repeat protein
MRNPSSSALLWRAFVNERKRERYSRGDGATRLERAAGGGDIARVRALLAVGAKVNSPTKDPDEDDSTPPQSALDLAGLKGHDNIVRLLLASGARVGGRWSEMHMAALHRGDATLVRHLAAAGADCNSATRSGRTPLHFAAMYSGPRVVTALLSAGADPLAVDQHGFTPLDFARNCGNGAVAEILEGAMGESLDEEEELAERRREKERRKRIIADYNRTLSASEEVSGGGGWLGGVGGVGWVAER